MNVPIDDVPEYDGCLGCDMKDGRISTLKSELEKLKAVLATMSDFQP